MDIDDFLSRFEGVTPSGDNKWKALCPAHDDHNPSLSITVVEDGKKLLKCFAGCTYGAILKALNLRSIDLNPSHGCTLEDYCRTKKLDQELLLRRGVSEYIAEDGGLPALRMPYLDAAGIEVGGRFRLALNGDKFRTFKGTSPVLYGLNILANPIEEVTIVEGESDTQTLLQFGYPAVGVPGASTWKEAWVPLFANKRIIFVIIEPDQGGRTLRAALEASELAPRINFVELPNGFKDVSSFYLDSPETFERRMDEVLDSYLLVSLGKRPRPAPRPYLIEGAVPSRCVSALYGEGGAGKALSLDTKLPTPAGWTTMADIKVGDELFDDKGIPCSVTHVFSVLDTPESYLMKFDDGTEIKACADHKWHTFTERDRMARARRTEEYRATVRQQRVIKDLNSGKGRHRHHILKEPPSGSVVTTAEIARSLRVKHGREVNHSIQVAEAISTPEARLPIAPYVLGAWLGDGSAGSAGFTSADDEIVDRIATSEAIRKVRSKYHYSISSGSRTQTDRNASFQARLRCLGILYDKHIPAIYLRSSVEQRLELLRGLMDTDGYVSTTGGVTFYNTNKQIIDGVRELVNSLGSKCFISKKVATLYGKQCGYCWNISWSPDYCPFYLERKVSRLTRNRVSNKWRYIVSCELIASEPMRCISVDSSSHLFLAGEQMVPTHNSLLALYTAICVCTGQDWFGHATQQGNVMYVDAELDEDEMTTRAYQLAEGMGLEKPPDNLRYHRLKGGVMAQLRMLKTLRKQYDIQLTVLDSLTIALLATAVNESKEIIPAMEALERQLGTTLVIDHTAKAQPGADLSQMTQFGSVFKRNMARSVFKLTGSTSGVVRVDHGKHNFGPVLKPWAYKCEWADTRSVKITTADALDVGSDYLPRKDKIVVYIRDKSGSWHRDLVSAFCNKSVKDSVSEPTLNRDLKELLAEGRIYKEARGLYHVTGAADTVVPAAVVDGWGASDLTDTVIQHLTGTTGTPDTWWE